MKKKYIVPSKDKKDWIDFTKEMGSIRAKDDDFLETYQGTNKARKLDLHGYSLDDANKIVKKFIIESFNKNYKKILIVTGKGSRSKSFDNPYVSENLSVLKNSVPEYIKNDENLNSIISKVAQADRKEGGDGAISIFLRDKKKL